jgi:hypothetical protein
MAMPRLRAVWASAQLMVTLATAAWGAYLLVTTKETPWAAGSFAAAVFFLVTVFLFAADHDDGRLVGLLGLAVFIIANLLLIFALMGKDALPALTNADHAKCAVFDASKYAPNCQWKVNLAWTIGGLTALVAIPEALLLLFGHGPGRNAEPTPEAQPPV